MNSALRGYEELCRSWRVLSTSTFGLGGYILWKPNSLIAKYHWTGFHYRQSQSRSHEQSHESAYDPVKIKNWSRMWRHKHNRIGVRILCSTYDLVKTRLSESSRSGRINQSQCMFPRFLIGLFFLLQLPTPSIWFSLDHKRNVSDRIISFFH